jgi:hypothetical protein
MWQRRLLSYGSQETARHRKKGPGTRYTFKVMSSVTYFLLIGPTTSIYLTSQISLPPKIAPPAGVQAFNMSLWEIIPSQARRKINRLQLE